MPTTLPPDLIELSLQYEKDLPPEFFTDRDAVESDLAAGRRPAALRPRAPDGPEAEAAGGWSATLRDAVLHELHILLCTKNPKYRDVRAQGKALSKPGAAAVAGALGAVLVGVPAGLVTGAVAFFLLLIAKIGVNTFCRVYTPAPPAGPVGKRAAPKTAE